MKKEIRLLAFMAIGFWGLSSCTNELMPEYSFTDASNTPNHEASDYRPTTWPEQMEYALKFHGAKAIKTRCPAPRRKRVFSSTTRYIP